MATDFAFAAFLWPVLLCIGFLLVLAVFVKPAPPPGDALLGLGRVRLARGYLGAVLATLICTAVSATRLGFDKVALGHISSTELQQLLPGYILYFFVLTTPFVLGLLTIMGLPALAALRKFNAMTVAWASIVALLFSIALGALTILKPYNQWCATHLAACGVESSFSTALLALPVAIGFTLAARIPLWRNATAA
ncbi:MAG: hypothetical protein DI562_20240 [Stenotrophomonas acidaminiphila]|nr:MAG: hypothetical protein DI562_20240 [Stenotrophomonas acidaminiphila]